MRKLFITLFLGLMVFLLQILFSITLVIINCINVLSCGLDIATTISELLDKLA